MSTKLDWTQKLGDAVLAQQPDVMDAIQRLRTKADANNKLTSTKEQKVTKKQEQGKQVIVIEPTDPNTVYVPYYDPAVVVRRMALSGVSAILFPAARIYRRRSHRGRDCIWRRLRSRTLGVGRKLLGRRSAIGATTTSTSTGPSISTPAETIGSTIRSIARASNTTTPTCSRSLATTIFVAGARIGWISAAAAASRCSSLAAVRPTLVIVEALIVPVPAAAPSGPARSGKSLAQDSGLSGGPSAAAKAWCGSAQSHGLAAAAMPSGILNPAKLPTRQSARGHASLGGGGGGGARAGGGGGGVREAAAAAVAAAVAAVVAVAADDDRTSRSSTISFFSAISPMALATIASAITAATTPMSA